MELPFAPFTGLQIRLDAKDVLSVEGVLVGDARCDVTCFVRLDGVDLNRITSDKCTALGFESAPYP